MQDVHEATFDLATPPSVNNAFVNVRGRGRMKSSKYFAWQRGEMLSLVAQRARPIVPPVNVTIALPMTMRGDADNRMKPTLDLLVKAGIIADDNQRIVRSVTIGFHDAPMMRVTVKTIMERAA